MMSTRLRLALVAGLAAVLWPGSSPTAAQDNDEFSWSGSVAVGKTLQIKNANGPLVAEYTEGNSIEVRAVKEGPAADREAVTFEVVEHDDGITICAIYPGRLWSSNDCEPDSGHMSSNRNKTKVTFNVRVPAGVRFVGETMNGRIGADNLRSDVELLTMNGAIEVWTTGWASASTMNGKVWARIGSTDWSAELELESMNGAIEVVLPVGASTVVRASTMNGRVQSDWPLEKTGWIRNKASGTIGSGGRTISLSTMNGNISLRRAS